MNPVTEMTKKYEWPTWLLVAAIYGGWLALTWHFHALPWYIAALFCPLVIAWHGSMRHEASHGHPMSKRVADWVGAPPLSLFEPFQIYKRTHLQHHRNELLTHPKRDPESYYYYQEEWNALPMIWRVLLVAHQTFIGRMVLGPPIYAYRFLKEEMGALLRGDYTHARIWAKHALWVALVLAWVMGVCGISFFEYLLFFAYPGTSLVMIRSFYEHRYDAEPMARSVIVENSPFFQWLFLSNNFHVVHHDLPRLPWYAIKPYYEQNKAHYQASNHNYVINGYTSLIMHNLITPVYHPVYPPDAIACDEEALIEDFDEEHGLA